MPNFTTNLNLEKPLGTEYYNIEVHNENSDKIDTFAGTVVKTNDIVDNLTTPSSTKPLSANMGKVLKDNEWRINAKQIGSNTTPTNLDTILEKGDYASSYEDYLFTNLPTGMTTGAFHLTVGGVQGDGIYGTQTIYDYLFPRIWHRVNISDVPGIVNFKPWVEILTSSTPAVPIGGILPMASSLSPSDEYPGTTWSIHIDGKFPMGGNQSNVGVTGGSNTKTIAVENLPPHTFTRGTMEIEGAAGTVIDWQIGQSFYTVAAFNNMTSGGTTGAQEMRFQASRNWTGASSSVGSGTALNVEPSNTKIILWKRLS